MAGTQGTRRKSNAEIEARLAALETGIVKHKAQLNKVGNFVTAAKHWNVPWDSAEQNVGISVSGTNITFAKAGTYLITTSVRMTSDVWNKWSLIDASNNVYGESAWAGGSSVTGARQPTTFGFMATIPAPGVYRLNWFNDAAQTVDAIAPSGVTIGQFNRSLTATITEV